MFLPPFRKPNTNNKGIVQYHTKVFVNNSWGNIQREHIARDGKDMNSFCMTVNVSESLPIIACLTDDVLNFFEILINKNFDIYYELYRNPPFPAWKQGLRRNLELNQIIYGLELYYYVS